jgi:hypothetical protein
MYLNTVLKFHCDLVILQINLYKLLIDSNNVLNCPEVDNGFDRLLIQIPTTRDSPVEINCNKSYVTNSLVAWSTVFNCIIHRNTIQMTNCKLYLIWTSYKTIYSTRTSCMLHNCVYYQDNVLNITYT